MYTINSIKSKKVKRFSRLTFFCSLFIFLVAFVSCSSPEDKQENSEQNLSALTKTTIPIEGMTCSACVASIKKKLKSMEALQEVEVSLQHRNATVFYEEGTITAQQVQQAINELGYKAGEPVTEESKQ
jgi:copper chaperone CopZ